MKIFINIMDFEWKWKNAENSLLYCELFLESVSPPTALKPKEAESLVLCFFKTFKNVKDP